MKDEGHCGTALELPSGNFGGFPARFLSPVYSAMNEMNFSGAVRLFQSIKKL